MLEPLRLLGRLTEMEGDLQAVAEHAREAWWVAAQVFGDAHPQAAAAKQKLDELEFRISGWRGGGFSPLTPATPFDPSKELVILQNRY